MKKNTLICFTFLVFNITFSQKNIGVFTGLNYSYFTDGIGEKVYTENSFGLQFGALYELDINDKINFRPKLSISQQGDRTKTKQTNIIELNQVDYELLYLNTALDFKFWNKIYLITGPQLGFLINQTHKGRDLGKASSIDIGFNLGTGFVVNKLFFELGIYQGFATVLEFDYSTGSKAEIKNGYLKFTLGYNL